MSKLATGARAGDTNALEQLLQRAGNTGPNASAIRRELTRVYCGWRTPRAIKADVRARCKEEIGGLHRQPAAAKAFLQLAIACHHNDRLYRSQWNDVASFIKEKSSVFDDPNDHDNRLKFDRFTTVAELSNASSRLGNVPVFANAAEVDRSPSDSFFSVFARPGTTAEGTQRVTALQEAIQRNGPVTLFVNVRNRHWTTVVVFPPQQPGNKVSCVLFDTLRNPVTTSWIRQALEDGVHRRFGKDAEVDFRATGAWMQGDTPDACGAFAVMAAQMVDQAATLVRETTPDSVERTFNAFVTRWATQSAEQHADEITQTRSHMTVETMRAVSPEPAPAGPGSAGVTTPVSDSEHGLE